MPIGILTTIWAYLQLREVVELPLGQKLDTLGTITFTITLLSFLLALTISFLFDNSFLILILLIALTLTSFGAFIYIERRAEHPLIDPHLFKIRIFSYGQLSALLNSIARGAVMLLLILFFQGPRGYDPLMASILILPMAIAIAITGPIGGVLSDKYGSRVIATLGLGISLVGLIGLSVMQYDTEYLIIAIWMFIMGLGSGLFQPPNTSAIMASVPPERRGIASATRAMLMNTGMVISMGIAFPLILSTIPMQELLEMFVVGGKAMPVEVQAAFTKGLTTVFIGSSIITVPAIIVSALRGKEDRRAVITGEDGMAKPASSAEAISGLCAQAGQEHEKK